MARRSFTQLPFQYGDGKFGFALGQTRNGQDEFITPIALWERDASSGLYLPPGDSASPIPPRFAHHGWSARTATLQNAATANGNGAIMDVSDLATVVFEVRGTFSATVNFEGSLDDVNWYPLRVVQMGAGGLSTTATTAGLYRAEVAGLKSVRARISGYVSGSVTVVARGSAAEAPVKDVQLSGSKARISSAPVTGVKTVTSTPSEIFAGASRKVGRSVLMIRNMSLSIRIRVGPSTVTDTTGFGIEPEGLLVLGFDPLADVPIYAVSEGGNVEVEVFEA